jgi:hypothetical protein
VCLVIISSCGPRESPGEHLEEGEDPAYDVVAAAELSALVGAKGRIFWGSDELAALVTGLRRSSAVGEMASEAVVGKDDEDASGGSQEEV